MATNLKLLLSRNKKSLEDFCKNNRIDSYKSFVDYCYSKNIQPYEEETYNEIMQTPIQQVDDKAKKPQKRKSKRGSKPSSS
jgi:hypothetical protein